MKRSLQQIAQAVEARLQGDGSIEIAGVASIGSAGQQDLVFVEDEKHLLRALQSGAGAVIAGDFAAASSGKPLLISRHPKLTFARAARFLQAGNHDGQNAGIHATAVVRASARLALGVVLEEHSVIGENAEIGEGTRIGAGCVVGRGVKVGRDCEIYPNVTLYTGTTLGDRVIVHAGAVLGSDGFGYVRDPKSGRYEKFPQVGKLVIEDDVEIGANTTIDRGALEETRIGQGTKIDNLVHIAHNCRLGQNVVIAAQTGLSGSIVIENDVVLGGQVGIGEHARIEEGVMLGGQGGVLPNKVLRGKGVAFWGTPAQPVREYLKQLAALARLVREKEVDVAIVVIGGHSRSVGKTSVVAGLISALREYDWTAVKITQYGHGVCSANGAPCDCATADHSWAISEDKDRGGESDTSRFLLAGAARALWVRTEQGRLAEAMPALRQRLERSRHVIVESNSVLKFMQPDLYLTVLDPGTEDFKSSAREFLDRAGAVILHDVSKTGGSAWQGVSLKPVAERPVFRITPPPYVTPEIVEFVRRSVALHATADSSALRASE